MKTNYNPTDQEIAEAAANLMDHEDYPDKAADKKTELAKLTPVMVLAALKRENDKNRYNGYTNPGTSVRTLAWKLRHYAQIGHINSIGDAVEGKVRRVLDKCPKAEFRGFGGRRKWIYMSDAARTDLAAKRKAREDIQDRVVDLAQSVAPNLDVDPGYQTTDVNNAALIALLEEVKALREQVATAVKTVAELSNRGQE